MSETAQIAYGSNLVHCRATRAYSWVVYILLREKPDAPKNVEPRERTYVTEGRITEHTTGEEGLTVELSEDGRYVLLPFSRNLDFTGPYSPI